MHAAVASLQKAARQLQLSGELERSEYTKITTQLREVANKLSAFERRTGKQDTPPVNFSDLLRRAAATAGQIESEATAQVPDGIMVEGPAHDLRDALCTLVEYGRSVGNDEVAFLVQIVDRANTTGAICLTELLIPAADLPDFVQRKLWDAARVRRGEVSIVSELKRCRVAMTLPIERRLAERI
jgi:hypothetical protein